MSITIDVQDGSAVKLPLTDEILVKARDWSELELCSAMDALAELTKDDLELLIFEAENIVRSARNLKALRDTQSEA